MNRAILESPVYSVTVYLGVCIPVRKKYRLVKQCQIWDTRVKSDYGIPGWLNYLNRNRRNCMRTECRDHFSLLALRAREIITSHFRIPPSGQLGPIFTPTILSVGLATPAVVLHQSDPTWPKFWREFWEVIVSRTLRAGLPFKYSNFNFLSRMNLYARRHWFILTINFLGNA